MNEPQQNKPEQPTHRSVTEFYTMVQREFDKAQPKSADQVVIHPAPGKLLTEIAAVYAGEANEEPHACCH